MKTSENINEIAKALATAQAEMKNASLNKVNPHFKSRYADLSEIRDKTVPILAKNGIAVVQGTSVTEHGLAVVNRLVHTSGQWIETCFPIAQDKPQAMGSAITYGRRYLLSAAAAITADEDDDANVANAKPVEIIGITGGTKGASKSASRTEFDRMIKEIRAVASITALKKWKADNVNEVDALPQDWFEELQTEYVDKKAELEGKAAA